MDKHLRPPRFDTEPNSLNAEKEWRHWYRTFVNFVAEVHPTPNPAPTEPADIDQLQQKKTENFDSLCFCQHI